MEIGFPGQHVVAQMKRRDVSTTVRLGIRLPMPPVAPSAGHPAEGNIRETGGTGRILHRVCGCVLSKTAFYPILCLYVPRWLRDGLLLCIRG